MFHVLLLLRCCRCCSYDIVVIVAVVVVDTRADFKGIFVEIYKLCAVARTVPLWVYCLTKIIIYLLWIIRLIAQHCNTKSFAKPLNNIILWVYISKLPSRISPFPPIKKNCILTINRLILRVYVCAHMFRYETLSRAFTRKCLKINKQTTTEVSEIHYFMIISATIHKTQWQYNKTNKFNSPLRLARFFSAGICTVLHLHTR